MNFLMLRSNSTQPSAKETPVEEKYVTKTASTLEGLVAEDPFQENTSSETRYSENDEFGNENDMEAVSIGNNNQVDSHLDVTDDNGFIVIPCKEVPENWTEASNALSLGSVDRSFVFPGEQIRILACLSAYKQDMEIITPFKVAAVMNKTGIGKGSKHNGKIEGQEIPIPETSVSNSSDQDNQLDGAVAEKKIDSQKDVSAGESILRMEDHKRQTEQLLRRFENSHFFVRIAESNESLWSKRRVGETYSESSAASEEQLTGDISETATAKQKKNPVSASIDRGKLDSRTSGGLARGAAKCCSLSNGDIMVLLQVNVGIQFFRDPILEILQFEKHQDRNLSIKYQDTPTSLNQDPYGELLKWLLPLNNSIPPPVRPSPPPTLSSSSSIRSASVSVKPAVSGSSSSQLFSFGHFRSYSMSSLPPNATAPAATPPASTQTAVVTTPETKSTIDQLDWNQFSFKKFIGSGKSRNNRLLSFRGVPLQQERFSVQCGLEGIFTPGRRWRRKIELIQPVEIRSFSVDCNTDDLLCVHVKNVSPAHAPDIVVFIDSIAIVFEEASKSGPPLFLPVACVESGNDYSLPNLVLRQGEEHSFILKPATSMWKHGKGHSDANPRVSSGPAESSVSSCPPWNSGVKTSELAADQFAVLVSCRCNYTESKLFFKQPTNWRPRISRDLVISVASEMSRQALGSDGTLLPVQVLTLQASNMTSDDLTLTVLAPTSFTSPPSVVSLSNSPMSPFSTSTELTSDKRAAVAHGENSMSIKHGYKVDEGPKSVSFSEQTSPIPDGVPDSDKGCSHLWLQSRVPLGRVPSQSTATVKLEVLPLTDGIITLDSLQVEVREKGITYVPEQSLKINATSSIATGIL